MKKIVIITFLCILCIATVWGQTNNTSVSLPELMTPSPKATMMNRFGNYPTNLYTGLVDITIPIYTIKAGSVTLPIEFKYHASGLKYDDLPMEVGYGWTLIAGGTVTYSARSAKAHQVAVENRNESFIKKVEDIGKLTHGSYSADQVALSEVMNSVSSPYSDSFTASAYRDSEFDEYNFSFPGHSGQFYLMYPHPSGPPDVVHPFTVPTSTTRLDGNFYNPYATDEYGNSYSFGIRDEEDGGVIQRNYTYYMTSIAPASGGSPITFSYKRMSLHSDDAVRRPIINTTYIVKSAVHYNQIETGNEGSLGMSVKRFNIPILEKISWRGGEILFIYSTTHVRSLKEIRISEGGFITKRIFLDKTDEAYLYAVRFCGYTNTLNNPPQVYSYKMEYNGKKPEGLYTPVDYWGYYNGSSSDSFSRLYVPNFTEHGRTFPGMDRSANEMYMKRGILTKITYPTQGYTLFSYEAHRNEFNQLHGGLRITEIRNYDVNGVLQERKWYQYNSARAVRPIQSRDFYSYTHMLEADYTDDIRMVTSDFTHMHIFSYGAFPRSSYFLQGSSVVYPRVTEYIGTTDIPEITTEYSFTDFPDEFQHGTMHGKSTEFPKWNYAWKCGKLYSKRVMNKEGRSVYHINNVYAEINRKDYLNLHVLPYHIIYGQAAERAIRGVAEGNFPEIMRELDGSIYDYYNYYVTSGEYKVVKSEESTNGIDYKTTYYRYNELGQVIVDSLINSDGSSHVTRYKYTVDLMKENPYNNLYHDMYWQANIHSPAQETSTYKDGTLVDRIIQEYKDWTFFYAPQYVRQLNYYEPRIKYDSYDCYGNPTAVRKDDLELTYYMWGYQGTRLLAEMKGASFNSVLGKDLVDRVSLAERPSVEDLQAIRALHDNTTIPNLRVTTLHYDAYRRLSSIIAPNGVQTRYEYDYFGRLLRIKDHNGQIIEQYEYDYKE